MSSLDFVVDTFVGSDGSKYYGTLKNGVPSGLGTCIWPNQCHYDGEWRNGVMHGFGTYVWKNGQRYDGEWKDGRREGIGIKTYVDGSMYDGFWKAGKKHGLGVFRPSPEESNSRRHSSAHWQAGAVSPSGQPTAAEGGAAGASDGAAAAGGMHHVESSQVLAEAEADAAEAAAKEAAAAAEAAVPAVPKPTASPRKGHQADAEVTSPFAAAAAALNSELSVVLPPTELTKMRQQWKPSLEVVPNGDTAVANEAATDKHKAALTVTALEADAPSSSPTITMARGAPDNSSGDAVAAAAAPRKLFVREYDMGQLLREYPLTAEEIKMIFGFLWPKNKVRRRMQKVLRRGPRMQKKLGEVVYKGHYSYSLMLELQLGIRYSVGKALRPRGSISGPSATSLLKRGSFAPRHWWSVTTAMSHTSCVSGGLVKDEPVGQQQRDFSDSSNGGDELIEYDFKEKLTVYFPSGGSSTTPAHPSTDFMWRDYCPRVFRRMRSAASIDEADYMLSLAGSQALRQLNSPGKSGSMFLLSDDERFLVKTMRKSEMSVLLDMLPAYAEHMERYPSSLITRFFGLHKVTPLHGRSVRFVVMANIFVTDLQIHRRYDIKGSTDGRTVGPEARAKAADGDPTVIFKDLDVDMRIVLEQAAHEQLMAQLKADCELLKNVGVMDYSLLLGVHYPQRNLYTRTSLEPVPSVSLDGLPNTSPLPVIGGSTAPGSVAASTQGSFVLLDSITNIVETAPAAVTAAVGLSAGGLATNPRSTLSDDDVQQPPQQLVRLAAQQQHQQAQLLAELTKAQQQQQQQGSQAEQGGTALGTEAPVLQEPAGWTSTAINHSGRSSREQVPYMQFLDRRRSTSEDVQWPAGVSGAATPPGGGPLGYAPGGTGGGAYPAGVGIAPTLSAAGSLAGSHYGDFRGGSVLAGAASTNAAGARNWELWSGAAEQEELASKVVERMQAMGFSEQRMKDVAELARLKILGGKLKKSATRKEPPSAVLQAMQQQRQEAEGVDGLAGHGPVMQLQLQPPVSPIAGAAGAAGAVGTATMPAGHPIVRQQQPLPQHLTSLRGAFTGLGVPYEEDEDIVDTPMALGLPDPKAPAAGTAAAGMLGSQQLGINMPALAVPTIAPVGAAFTGAKAVVGAGAVDHQKGPDEVVLCFGIIDILQDYSARKVLERTVKGVTHEKASISVAPPKHYARRFLQFATSKVFMSELEYKQLLRQAASDSSGALFAAQQSQQVLHQQPHVNGVLHAPPWSLAPIVTQGAQAVPHMSSPGATAGDAPLVAPPPLPEPSAAAGQQQPHQQQTLQPQDSYPVQPGQLSTESSQLATAGNAAEAASEGCMVLKQMGRAAASPVLPDVGSPLLHLLAAPFNTVELMSGGDRVSTDEALGAEMSKGVQQGVPVPAAEQTDSILVPAVVVELQGVVPSHPASKQGSLDGQQNVGLAVNGQVISS